MHPSAAPLTTTALCRAAGVTRGMLRLYEREGLLAAPPRSASGYRHYPADTSERLLAIRHLKELGFGLKEIALLLSERDALRMDPARLRTLAAQQVQRIDERMQRLRVVREYVNAVAEGDMALLSDPECGFLMRFLGAAETLAPTATQTPTQTEPSSAPATSTRMSKPQRTPNGAKRHGQHA